MKKLFLITIVALAATAQAQTLFKASNGRYGYKDENGKVIIEAKYSEADSFSEGLAAVKEFGSYWGFIDKTGKEIIPFNFYKAAKFSEGLAPVLDRESYKWGFINKKGKLIIKPQYEDAEYFSEGLAKVKIKENTTFTYVNFINKEGETVVWKKYANAESFSECLAAVAYNGKWGFIDNSGKEVIALIYNSAWSFSNGMANVILNGKRGQIDKTGKEFGDIILSHKLTPFKSDNKKYGFKDEHQKVFIEPKYDYAFDFTEDLAAVSYDGKWGFIDNQGKEVITLKYDDAYSFSDGLAKVKLNGKYGFIDKLDKEVISIKYDAANNFSNGYAFVTLNGEKLEIDKNNKFSSKDKKLSESFNVIFDNITNFDALDSTKTKYLQKRLKFEVTRHEIKEYVWQEKNLIWSGSYKLLRTQKIEKSGTHTDTIKKLSGLLYLCSDGTIYYFFINDKKNCLRIKQGTTTNDYITPVNRYEDEGNFLFEQKLNSIYSTKGNSLSLPEPSGELKGFGNTNTNNLSLLKQTQGLTLYKDSVSNKYGFKGLFGKVIVEPKYDEATKFVDDMARVKLNGKWGYLDATGKEIIPPKYERADDFANGRAKVTLNGKSFFIDKTGKTID